MIERVDIEIPYKFTPRWYQEPVYNALNNGYRRGIAVFHRRAGKDKTFINIMAREAVKRIGTYYYFYPTYNQGRKAIWDGMDKSGFKFTDHIPMEIRANTNNTEMKITLKCGSIIQVVGTDKWDSIMSTNPIGCVFSEYSLQDPSAYDYVRPILAENGGWALFNGTPRGHNHMYRLFKMAEKNPKWFSELLTVNDTHAITDQDIQDDRDSGMEEDMVQQEYYCSWNASTKGAYYAKEIAKARKEGRITFVPVEPSVPVDGFWDLGMDDATTIWMVQQIRGELRVLKYFEDRNKETAYYINMIRDWRDDKGCVIGKMVLPHDGNIRARGTGISDFELIRDHFKIDSQVVDRPKNEYYGVSSVRKVFPRCWFDEEGTIEGFDYLAQYRAEYHEDRGVQDTKAVHDRASHAAKAFQTMGLYYERKLGMAPVDNIIREHEGVKYLDTSNVRADTVATSSGGAWMF
jgi:hypothetical protein